MRHLESVWERALAQADTSSSEGAKANALSIALRCVRTAADLVEKQDSVKAAQTLAAQVEALHEKLAEPGPLDIVPPPAASLPTREDHLQ